MGRYFYDGEFLEDGRTIDLLSIGIVAEDGREYYAINAEADLAAVARHPWLMANVVPHLPIGISADTGHDVYELLADPASRQPRSAPPTLWWDTSDPRARDLRIRQTIAREVKAFIEQGGRNRADHELWGWYSAYDHVALCQLFGPMVDLPNSIPMFTHDLRQLAGSATVPKQTGPQHDALADARWNFRAWQWLRNRRSGRVVSMNEPDRHLGALDALWQHMPDETRAEIKRLTNGTGFGDLLQDVPAVLEAAAIAEAEKPRPVRVESVKLEALLELTNAVRAMDADTMEKVLRATRGTRFAGWLTRIAQEG